MRETSSLNETETAPGDGAVGETWARPQAGARLGRYILTEQLGAGAMGVVYAARDETLGRDVALKLITPRRTQSSGAQLRFEQEARMLAAVEHPVVVEVYDVGRHAGRSFLVMPRLPGRTLRDWLRTSRPRAEILAMFDVIGQGLAAAHEAGVLHCDFKPDNVLLDAAGRPKVADFGLARLELPETQDGEDSAPVGRGSGTPAYLAPELHMGEAPSVASDIYAFHIALFEALKGARPFGGRGLLRAKLRGLDRADVSELPRTLRTRLLEGLDPNPRARPRTFDPLSVSRRKFKMWAVPIVAGLLVSAGVAVGGRPSLSPSCEERADGVTGDASRWNGDPENAAARATVDRVHRELTRWRTDWRVAFVGACDAGDQAQADCLSKVRIAGESWMRPPSNGDSELGRVMLWSGRVGSLPQPRACTGTDEATDPAWVAELAEVRFSLGRGHTREGVAQALALADRAGGRNDAKTRFAAQILAGEGLGDLQEFERAEALLRDVIAAAESTGQWRFATEACVQLIWAVGVGDTDLEEARVLAKRAEAYAARAGDVRLQAGALAMLSGALERRGAWVEAAAVVEDGLTVVQEHPDAPRMGHVRGVLIARRVSLAAKRNDLALVLDSVDAVAQLELDRGAFSGSILAARSALAHAQGLAGQFDASIAGFEIVADRYAQMGPDTAFWVHQNGVNAAQMELRAERPEAAQARLEMACPAMALLRSETHTNVLLCSLSLMRAQALLGAPINLEGALEILGTIEARYDATRLPTQQARVAAAEIAITLQERGQLDELLSAKVTIPSLEAEMAWLQARAEMDPARAVAKYEAVCSIASPALRPDLCLRALEKLGTRSLTIDVEARKQEFLAR